MKKGGIRGERRKTIKGMKTNQGLKLTISAGGYDAIVLLIVDEPKVITAIEKVWAEWKEMNVKPLKAGNSNGGLRSETVDGVEGLKVALERL